MFFGIGSRNCTCFDFAGPFKVGQKVLTADCIVGKLNDGITIDSIDPCQVSGSLYLCSGLDRNGHAIHCDVDAPKPLLRRSGSGAWQSQGPPPPPIQPRIAEARVTELNRRVQLLDDNNRQLHAQLAQSEQKAEVFKDEAELLREQLASMSEQLDASKLMAQMESRFVECKLRRKCVVVLSSSRAQAYRFRRLS